MANKISIEELKIGMMFTKPLYTEENSNLIPAGVKITEADYNRLVRWGVKELFTEGELVEEDEEFENHDDFEDNADDVRSRYVGMYNWCVDKFGEFIKRSNDSNDFDVKMLEVIKDKLFELIEEYKNQIISYMGLENPDYHYLYTHTVNSTILAIIGANQLDLDEGQMRNLVLASLLHDIGMLKVPDNILNKNGELTSDEYSIIKNHPISAYKQLNKSQKFSQDVLDAVLQHHEQYDGNGYPRKIKEDKISLFARIISIADAFEAQIAYRVYRKSKTGYLAMKSVLAEAKNKFDPKVLRAFLTTLSIYPPGTLIQMNNNSIGTVISVNPDAPLRPIVKIIIDEFGEKIDEIVEVDLRSETDFFITNVLNRDEYKHQ